MHGVNRGGWLSQYPYKDSHYDDFIVDDDVRKKVKWGVALPKY